MTPYSLPALLTVILFSLGSWSVFVPGLIVALLLPYSHIIELSLFAGFCHCLLVLFFQNC